MLKYVPSLRHFVFVFIFVLFVSILLTTISLKSNITEGNGLPITSVSSLDTVGIQDANGIFVSGSYAYVVTDNNSGSNPEFYIVDISNPQTPSLVGSLDVNISVNKVYVYGNYAYLATKKDAEDIIVLNITNKAQPLKVTGINIPNNSEALAITGSGSSLYVGFANKSSYREFYILNISNPISPQTIGSHEVGGAVNNIVVDGNYVYLATTNNLKEFTMLDLSAPSNPVQSSYFDLLVNGGANGVAVSNDRVYLVANNNASQPDLFILNVAPSSTPVLVASLDLDTSNTNVVAMDQTIFISTQTSARSVMKIDAVNSYMPYLVSTYNGGARANDLIISGHYIYVASANNTGELQLLNSQEGPRPRPNIVLILTDDQQWQSISYMPTVQSELVGKGIKFNNAFVTTGLCCPSRASILTGQYAHNHGVMGNVPPYGGATVFNASSTIATWLREVGYSTGFFGKYLNGYHLMSPTIPPGWDEWNVFKGDVSTGDDNYYDYTLNENGTENVYDANRDEEDGLYSTDLLANRVSNFIQSRPTGQPFFVVYAPFAPHTPFTPAIRHFDTLANIAPYRPASWQEADMSDKSPWWRTLPDRVNQSYNNNDPNGFTNSNDIIRQRQLEMLQSVDDGIGTILNSLNNKGVAEDTLIVFMSDNGYMWGEHWWNQKICQYDECSRVPFIIRYPLLGNTPREDNRFVLNIDLAPTLADFASTSIPSSVNGKSLKKVLSNSENFWRNDFLLEGWNHTGNINQPPTYASVHNAQWKYIKVEDGGLFEELYNLTSDPFELDNVASSSNNASVLSQMRARLNELLAE